MDLCSEYDVPYHMRVSIDMKINCGKWFEVIFGAGHSLVLKEREVGGLQVYLSLCLSSRIFSSFSSSFFVFSRSKRAFGSVTELIRLRCIFVNRIS